MSVAPQEGSVLARSATPATNAPAAMGVPQAQARGPCQCSIATAKDSPPG